MSFPWSRDRNVSFRRNLESIYFGVVIAITLAFSLVAYLTTQSLAICFGCVAICLGALVVGIFLCRLLSRPVQLLEKNLLKLQNLDLESTADGRSHILEVSHMQGAIDDMRRLLKSYMRYVPRDLVAGHIKSHTEAKLSAEKREVSIFFTDISDFTSICEKIPPDHLVEELKPYFKGMTEIILEEHGTIDKYIGDTIMAFWNAPTRRRDHALCACRAALWCIRYGYGISREWQRKGLPALHTRIGLNTGEVVVGNIGFEERLNYTIMGNNVNLASRLQGLNKYYGTEILITESMHECVKSEIAARLIDIVVVKGMSKGIPIYEIVGEGNVLDMELRDFLRMYDQGMHCYLDRDWAGAIEKFSATLRMNSQDNPSRIMLERCRSFVVKSPPNDWTGEIVMREK